MSIKPSSATKQAGLLKHQHFQSIMFTPRPYQIELVERALTRNTIACLNSAAGKSFIWMTYLREILGINFQQRSAGHNFALVLFPSENQVNEHSLNLKNHINYDVAMVTSDSILKVATSSWRSVVSENKIIVTTPSILYEAFGDPTFLPQEICVLIIDECNGILDPTGHQRAIMQKLNDIQHRPYILGITCSLLKKDSSASQLQGDIETMEHLLHCKAETATDLIALDGHSPAQPDEKIVLCGVKKTLNSETHPDVTHPDALCSEIHDILVPAIRWLETCNISSNAHIVMSQCNPQSASTIHCDQVQTVAKNSLPKEDGRIIDESASKCDGADEGFENDEIPPQTSSNVPQSSPRQETTEDFRKMSLTVLSQVKLVLDVLGPWCAHRLVILLLKQLQKSICIQDSVQKCPLSVSKWRYFLLRYTDSHLRSVYTLYQLHVGNQKNVDLKLVTPKVNRLLQVLKEYKPPAEPEKKSENSKLPKYNDRSEVGYVSWWQDSDAEEDDEEVQMMLEGNRKKVERWNGKDAPEQQESKAGSGKVVRQYHHGNTLCGIVFVKERYVAVMLQRLLKEISREDPDLRHVSSAHITLLANSSLSGMQEKMESAEDIYSTSTSTDKQKQEEVLRNFRSHELNLLVSTNCLEEFVEIPKCNLVLRFDSPDNYKSYILSKGRTRSNNSTYMMLVHEGEKVEFMSRLQEYKKIEKVLQDSVYDKQSNGKSPPDDYDYFDVKESDSDEDEELAKVPPYYSGPTTCVTLDSAIHVVNRYCSRLPSDPFTHLSPRCELVKLGICENTVENDEVSFNVPSGYQCSLQLPINSHVRNSIEGMTMSTALLAKKAVALEACKVLHRSGELDDHFLPIGKEMVKYAEELDPWPEEKSKVPGRAGTTKRRQTYEKEVPLSLSNCLPRANVPLYLYEIHMKLNMPMPDELNVRRRRLHAPEETTRCFGILTTKPLPPILGFPIFTRSGEELVHIRLCRSFISLGEHHIRMIQSFHHYIFSDMLRIDRVPLVFKADMAPMQILVVIINKSIPTSTTLDIDWKFMCRVAKKRRIEERMRCDPWFRHRHLEAKGRKNIFVFRRSKYEDGVVVAKYRSPDQPNRFYVAEIKDELDPYSNFPSAEYESFHHYYRIKYGLNISCLNQPLLDVDHTSSRLNLLTPRYMNQKGKALPVTSLEKKRAKYETLTNRQILVPELCDLHPIPASLWRKAVCIPSILYRLSDILVAEELRQRIAKESGIGKQKIPPGWQWPDLDFGWDNTTNGQATNSAEHDKTMSNGVNQYADSNVSNTLNSSVSTDTGDGVYSSEVGEVQNREQKEENSSNEQIDLEGNDTSPNNEPHPEKGSVSDEKPSEAVSTLSSDSELSCGYDIEDFKDYFDSSDEQNTTEDSKSKICQEDVRMKTAKVKEECSPISFSLATIPRINSQNEVRHSKDTLRSIGPSPGLILQALTLSNASDGFNLERFEMLGDSFLKHAVTVYLFCTYPDAHEGKLSYMRSKKVSNYNLYRIGLQKNLPGKMTALIFDPAVNWLPPGYVVGAGTAASENGDDANDLKYESFDEEVEIGVWASVPGQKSPKQEAGVHLQAANNATVTELASSSQDVNIETAHAGEDEEEEEIYDEDEIQMIDNMLGGCLGRMNGLRGSSHPADRRQNVFPPLSGRSMQFVDRNALLRNGQQNQNPDGEFVIDTWTPVDGDGKPLCASDPLLIDLHTQHSLADKSIADCVEAILGTYLTTCGHRAAQLLLCYFGLKVLPKIFKEKGGQQDGPTYGFLKEPTNVLLDESQLGRRKLNMFTKDLESFEMKIGYTFNDKAYLLQAFTHASYYLNTITDCYQRLEFLGDAVLDFLITCRLFNDPRRRHSPGALTDLRSALVNNTIFASLAVRHDFHKYFKAISPELHNIIDGFVRYQHLQEEAQGMDAQLAKHYYPIPEENEVVYELEDIVVPINIPTDQEDEEEEEEDVEVPKALGDIFESVAGAIYMDSGMDLDEVWRVYEPMMSPLIEKFSSCVPRAPVRELLEMEPETAKFSWAEKRCDGKVRVTVEVIGKGSFKGVGRSYRIAKSAAARRALRFLKSHTTED